jgi:hypothetical protein
MAKGGKGGMQTAGLHYSICCPKCGKPAARKEETAYSARYLHFTKRGSVWHEVKSAPSAAHRSKGGKIMRICPERQCIANVNGDCAVESCRGAITRLGPKPAWELEQAAKFYAISKAAFEDYFGEEEPPGDGEENTQCKK